MARFEEEKIFKPSHYIYGRVSEKLAPIDLKGHYQDFSGDPWILKLIRESFHFSLNLEEQLCGSLF